MFGLGQMSAMLLPKSQALGLSTHGKDSRHSCHRPHDLSESGRDIEVEPAVWDTFPNQPIIPYISTSLSIPKNSQITYHYCKINLSLLYVNVI